MAAIRMKTEITMKLSGHGQSHSRSKINVRDVYSIIDEPVERNGTNLGLSPTETLVASLIGCTHVISTKCARNLGFTLRDTRIEARVKFDRRGVLLSEEVDRPFSDVILDIETQTDGTPEQMEAMKADLEKFCPIAKVFRAAGISITENWTTKPLEPSHEH